MKIQKITISSNDSENMCRWCKRRHIFLLQSNKKFDIIIVLDEHIWGNT